MNFLNLNNAKTKYVPLLDLGLIEDVDATLQEFNDQAEGAGLEKVIGCLQRAN